MKPPTYEFVDSDTLANDAWQRHAYGTRRQWTICLACCIAAGLVWAATWRHSTGELPVQSAVGWVDDSMVIQSLGFSEDGQWLIAGGMKATDGRSPEIAPGPLGLRNVRGFACICDGGSGRLVRMLEGAAGVVYAVAMSPDGLYAAAGTALNDNDQGQILLWETGGKLLRRFDNPLGYVAAVAFSRDSRTLVGAAAGQLNRWDLATAQPLHTMPRTPGMIQAIAFSPDGLRLATASRDGIVRVIDVDSGELRQSLVGHRHMANGVAWYPDGRTLVSCGWGEQAGMIQGDMIWWDLSDDGARRMVQTDDRLEVLALSGDGRHIVTGGGPYRGRLIHWNTTGGSEDAHDHEGKRIEALAFSPAGALAIASVEGGLTILPAPQAATSVAKERN